MIQALSAVEQASFDALKAGVTKGTVYQDVPEDTPPPVVILGDLDWKPLHDSKDDDPDCSCTLTVSTVTEGHERQPCIDLVGEVEASLRGLETEQNGWTLEFRCLGSSAALAEDAGSYVGTSTFEITARL